MKATELRLNNYVNYDNEIHLISSLIDVGGVCKITNLKSEVISQHTTNLDPIPLTEEWLDNFGFTQQGRYFNKNVDGFDLAFTLRKQPNFDGFLIEWYFTDELSATLTDVMTVHRLQNIFYNLTGEELTLTNKK
jgi:hypothetical protein